MRHFHKPLALMGFITIFIISLSGLGLGAESVYYRMLYGNYSAYEHTSVSHVVQSATVQSTTPLKRIFSPSDGVWVVQTTDRNMYTIHPFTAQTLQTFQKNTIFELFSIIHTKILLGDIGKFITVLSSLVLILISISGFTRALKRQGGFAKLFIRQWWDTFVGALHTMGGVIICIPILIIATTGFITGSINLMNLSPHKISTGSIESTPNNTFVGYKHMPPLQNLKLHHIQQITLPAPTDIYDVITIKTRKGDILYLDQYTGKLIGTDKVSTFGNIIYILHTLHTTNQNGIWMFIWGITGLGICILCITGVYITIRRWYKNRLKSND